MSMETRARTSSTPPYGVLLGVLALVLVVAANSMLSIRAARKLVDTTRWVDHTRIVTDELDATLSAMLNVENWERGYLYTGERHNLERYERGKPEVAGHLDTLAQLTSDNPVQTANFVRLRTAANDAMAFFQDAAALKAAGRDDEARRMVLSGGGHLRMDAVRSALAEMKAEELRLLSLRSAEAQRSRRYLLLAIPTAHAFMALLLVFAGLLVSRNVRKRSEIARRFRELAEREHDARQDAEAAHDRTEHVLSGISEMFILLDRAWKIDYVNDQVVRISGKSRETLVGQEYWKAFPEMLRMQAAFLSSMETQTPHEFEILDTSLRKWFSMHLYPSPAAMTIFAQDITGIKRTQDALVQSEKLAAVGRMASTVAHEINNPLEAVTNLIWLARYDPSASQRMQHQLAMADEELRRVAHIAKQTLGFYRDATAPAMVHIADVLDGVIRLYSSRLESKQVAVRRDYDNSEVFGYAGELRQLFSNLLANAVDAVQTRGALAVKISQTRNWSGDRRPGVRISIGDNGGGIAAEHLSKLFEPFFSTKGATGTGLGLWVAKQIAEKHGGRITVRSSPRAAQHYTVVSVFLPERSEIQLQAAAALAGSASRS